MPSPDEFIDAPFELGTLSNLEPNGCGGAPTIYIYIYIYLVQRMLIHGTFVIIMPCGADFEIHMRLEFLPQVASINSRGVT